MRICYYYSYYHDHHLLVISRIPSVQKGLSHRHWPVPRGSRPPGAEAFGEGITEQTALLWPQACVRAGQLVVTNLAGQNILSERQHVYRIACSGEPGTLV